MYKKTITIYKNNIRRKQSTMLLLCSKGQVSAVFGSSYTKPFASLENVIYLSIYSYV